MLQSPEPDDLVFLRSTTVDQSALYRPDSSNQTPNTPSAGTAGGWCPPGMIVTEDETGLTSFGSYQQDESESTGLFFRMVTRAKQMFRDSKTTGPPTAPTTAQSNSSIGRPEPVQIDPDPGKNDDRTTSNTKTTSQKLEPPSRRRPSQMFRSSSASSGLSSTSSSNSQGHRSKPQLSRSSTVTGSRYGEGMSPRRQGLAANLSSAAISDDANRRTLPLVLQRLSTLIDGHKQATSPSDSGTPREQKEFLQRYWMPDSSCRVCYDCGERFNAIRRRHHCRICGQIFCGKCSEYKVPGQAVGSTGSLRACEYCADVISSYLEGQLTSVDSPPALPSSSSSLTPVQEEGSFPVLSSPSEEGSLSRRLSATLTESPDLTPRSNTPRLLPFNKQAPFKADESVFDAAPQRENIPYISKEERRLLIQESQELRTLALQIVAAVPTGITLGNHRYRLRAYPDTFLGRDLVDWLVKRDKVKSGEQAKAVGQALLAARLMRSPIREGDETFLRDVPYKMNRRLSANISDENSQGSTGLGNSEPGWLQSLEQSKEGLLESGVLGSSTGGSLTESVSSSPHRTDRSIPLDLKPSMDDVFDNGDSSAHSTMYNEALRPPSNAADMITSGSPSDRIHSPQLEEGESETAAQKALERLHKEHISELCRHLLSGVGLSLSWEEVLCKLAHQVAALVRPDVRFGGDRMDIRDYVHIKKIRSGTKADSGVSMGAMFTKEVTHRRMHTSIVRPAVMLLNTSVEYERIPNKLSSLDPQILQEQEYLQKCVSKIVSHRPDVLLVGKTVSRLAQDMLRGEGVTLFINVKKSVLKRVARLTMTDIHASIDSLVNSRPRLGTCRHFEQETYRFSDGYFKTLTYFSGCPAQLGCSVTLRGPSYSELVKVKPVFKFLLYACFHSRLEQSYLTDQSVAVTLRKASEEDDEEDGGAFSHPIGVEKQCSGNEKGAEAENASKDFKNPFEYPSPTSFPLASQTNKSALLKASTDVTEVSSGKSANPRRSPSLLRHHSKSLVLEQAEIDPLNKLSFSSGNERDIVFDDDHSCLSETIQAMTLLPSVKITTAPTDITALFRKALTSVILSVSPHTLYEAPFFASSVGAASPLRVFFPAELYCSPLLGNLSQKPLSRTQRSAEAPHTSEKLEHRMVPDRICGEGVTLADPHSFLSASVSLPFVTKDITALFTSFRASEPRVRVKGSKFPLLTNGAQASDWAMDEEGGETGVKFDCFSVSLHQSISILFSSFSYTSERYPDPCVHPWIVSMEYYGKRDMALGNFLERFCFKRTYKCGSCTTPMQDHIRRFAHSTGCLHLIIKEMEDVPSSLDNSPVTEHPPVGDSFGSSSQVRSNITAREVDNEIFMWTYCCKCEKATPVVRMSPDTWSMSFAKYLELRLVGRPVLCRHLPLCTHSLHRDYNQYYRQGSIIASFKYTGEVLRELYLPPAVISINDGFRFLKQDVTATYYKAYEMFNAITELLATVSFELPPDFSPEKRRMLDQLKTEHQEDRQDFQSKIGQIKEVSKEASTSGPGIGDFPTASTVDSLVSLELEVAQSAVLWKGKLEQLEKSIGLVSAQKIKQLAKTVEVGQHSGHSSLAGSKTDITYHSTKTITPGSSLKSSLTMEEDHFASDIKAMDSVPGTPTSDVPEDHGFMHGITPGIRAALRKTRGDRERGSHSSAGSGGSFTDILATEVAALAEGQTLADSPESCPTPQSSTSNSPTRDHQTSGTSSAAAAARKLFSTSQGPPDTITAEGRRKMKIGKEPVQLTDPCTLFCIPEIHYFLPDAASVPVIVRDDEPSSVIAYTLSSKDYLSKIQEISADEPKKGQRRDKSPGGISLPGPSADQPSTNESKAAKIKVSAELPSKPTTLPLMSSIPSVENFFADEEFPDVPDRISGDKNKQKAAHFELAFEEKNEISWGDKSAQFYCKVYFADQFRRLREKVFEEGEDTYIRSLSRCVRWHAKGGKSGSAFSKTRDDRFVLKQMNRYESQSFLDFGADYVRYVLESHSSKKPTALAKILGVYRIGLRNFTTGKALKQDVLVMENLLYGRRPHRVFDLKGSVRNRLAAQGADQVLLDENLLKYALDSPLYVRPHTKTVLTQAVMNDTGFLSKHLIMDYSLLLAVDNESNELVVGIIDYIRTFTWDKKLEMVVKATGILGGQGKLPTIVSPEVYRDRFVKAMDVYFHEVPDHWSGLATDDC